MGNSYRGKVMGQALTYDLTDFRLFVVTHGGKQLGIGPLSDFPANPPVGIV
jgi:hypothetical protein